MSISAVSGVAQVSQQAAAKPRQTPAANDVTPFGQQLDAQTAQAQGDHHHPHGGASQSVTSAAGSGGGSTSGSLASSLLGLLS